jgi:hypothetical protein
LLADKTDLEESNNMPDDSNDEENKVDTGRMRNELEKKMDTPGRPADRPTDRSALPTTLLVHHWTYL